MGLTHQQRPNSCTCSMLRLPPSTGATLCLEPHTTLDSISQSCASSGQLSMPSCLLLRCLKSAC